MKSRLLAIALVAVITLSACGSADIEPPAPETEPTTTTAETTTEPPTTTTAPKTTKAPKITDEPTPQTVEVTPLNKDFYVKEMVNIRTAPDLTEQSKLGKQLKTGEKVKILGEFECSDGDKWYMYEFEGDTVYSLSSFFSSSKPTARTNPPANQSPPSNPPANNTPSADLALTKNISAETINATITVPKNTKVYFSDVIGTDSTGDITHDNGVLIRKDVVIVFSFGKNASFWFKPQYYKKPKSVRDILYSGTVNLSNCPQEVELLDEYTRRIYLGTPEFPVVGQPYGQGASQGTSYSYPKINGREFAKVSGNLIYPERPSQFVNDKQYYTYYYHFDFDTKEHVFVMVADSSINQTNKAIVDKLAEDIVKTVKIGG